MRFELLLAYRHLKSGGSQTFLTVAAVAVAVTVVIFINSLIAGVQKRIIFDLIGSIPHITVRAPERDPKALSSLTGSGDPRLMTTTIEKQGQRRNNLDEALKSVEQIRQIPGISLVAPSVRGQGFLIRGNQRFGVTVSGGDPAVQEKVFNLQKSIVAGKWQEITSEDVVIGFKLADDAGIKLGDRIRIQSSENVTAVLTVAGIFDTGQNATDQGQVFVNMRAGQRLFNLPGSVTSILVRLNEAFDADRVAAIIQGSLGYKAESWMQEIPQFVNGIRAQNGSRFMISGFALLASAFSIASVLIVSVLQKSKQIGILKSIGAREGQILRVFVLEGLGVSVVGALVGAGLGLLLVLALGTIKQEARFGKVDQLFPVVIDPATFGTAMAAAILATMIAAILPARRASRMNPVEVIRAG